MISMATTPTAACRHQPGQESRIAEPGSRSQSKDKGNQNQQYDLDHRIHEHHFGERENRFLAIGIGAERVLGRDRWYFVFDEPAAGSDAPGHDRSPRRTRWEG